MITITDTELEIALKTLLQQQVEFILYKKRWRAGKVLLFKQSGFYIEFTIFSNKNKIERFEVPIPFKIIQKQKTLQFSYLIKDLFFNNEVIVNEILKSGSKCKSKYFNSFMEINII